MIIVIGCVNVVNVVHERADEEKSSIRCRMCQLYFHFRCIGLCPTGDIVAFTCSQCKLAASRQKNMPQSSVNRHRVTEDCGDDDLLQDFFDSKNDGPNVGKSDKMKSDDTEDDDDDDDDEDCIIID